MFYLQEIHSIIVSHNQHARAHVMLIYVCVHFSREVHAYVDQVTEIWDILNRVWLFTLTRPVKIEKENGEDVGKTFSGTFHGEPII